MAEYKCPECGQADKFKAHLSMEVFLDGKTGEADESLFILECVLDLLGDEYMECVRCRHSGTVFDFERSARDAEVVDDSTVS